MEDKKYVKSSYSMAYLFMITYFVSYITRINYGAVIAEMVRETSMAKPLLSMALTGSFVTYGAGQIISGMCGDRFQPKRLVFWGLIVTTAMNIIIPFCRNAYQMTAVWCVNGFAQAFMWPPLVRLMSVLFNEEEYKKASVIVSWGSSFGTIAVYLASPVLIAFSGWRSVFFFSAACSLAMSLVWQKTCCNIDMDKTGTRKDVPEKSGRIITPMLLGIMAAIVLQGALRDGVTTWMPSYISETYNLSSVISILTGVVLPIFSIISFQITSHLYRKVFTNPLKCAGIMFGAGTAAALVLFLFTGSGAALSVILAAILTGCMHGVNLILICMIPPFYKGSGNVSTISGVLNACTYIGSAISTYGIAMISEAAGWRTTIGVWVIIAAAGTLICALCVSPWRNKF